MSTLAYTHAPPTMTNPYPVSVTIHCCRHAWCMIRLYIIIHVDGAIRGAVTRHAHAIKLPSCTVSLASSPSSDRSCYVIALDESACKTLTCQNVRIQASSAHSVHLNLVRLLVSSLELHKATTCS